MSIKRTMVMVLALLLALALCARTSSAQSHLPPSLDNLAELRAGTAFPAFDHLGDIGYQAKAAAACGVTILYASGLGGDGYSGLPDAPQWAARRQAAAAYVREAKSLGIPVVLGYLCATSIIDLPRFDAHWDASFRARFRTPPAQWRQQDRNGRPLPSWYGGAYQPACMNNPDWRTYQRYMIQQQLETGHDGIFFDNPTVHPKGCYCPHCMRRFADFLRARKIAVADASPAAMRKLAETLPKEFLQFRGTIAADFFADMRAYARSLRPHALLTANNSLNSPEVLYKQNRTYGYDLHAMSASEDFVTIEDMTSQPRTLPGTVTQGDRHIFRPSGVHKGHADGGRKMSQSPSTRGRTIEYGPTYQQLRAIIHGKPLVVCTIAEADYHTPPHLTRLAMAEAAAYGANYLLWPTWPQPMRQKMIDAVRPEADLLRRHQGWLAAQPRRDAILFLPYRRWLETDTCKASALAAALSRANVQYEVLCEDDFRLPRLKTAKVLLVESLSVLDPAEKATVKEFRRAGGAVIAADAPGAGSFFSPEQGANEHHAQYGRAEKCVCPLTADDWLQRLQSAIGIPSIAIRGPITVRAVVRDQPQQTLVHLLNLNIYRRSSFEDEVHPAENLRLTVRVPFESACSVQAITADAQGTPGSLAAHFHKTAQGSTVEFVVPRLEVAAMVAIMPETR